ncbi:EamA family transporter [Paenibacillus oleatilyticus]|uniref:EamA family transporter n=1 Tax=Paenibacillus oleatilyticus TaxID=2594886 RepID=UPI001C1F74FD|nr:EamA family transporter [Paenibacillus oleatilyticus]MBU7319741.1 EamA family transporter [Paenibacillus oleatilyticus]
MNLFYIIISVSIGAVGQILLKFGATRSNFDSQNFMAFLNVYNVLGLLFYGLSALLWMIILRKVELSYAYPLVSLGYILVFFASYFLFHESISFMRIVGLVVVLVGIVIVAKS